METRPGLRSPSLQGPESKEQTRPRRKYYYHGTIAQDFQDINTEGLRFKEGRATLSIAPSFTIKRWSNPTGIVEHRQRSGRGRVHNLAAEEKQGLVLIVKPEDYEASHISTFPKETETQVYFRNHWERYHHAFHKPKDAGLLKERLKRKKSSEEGIIPPEQIKMAFLPTPELKKILDDFSAELRAGNIPLDEYIRKIATYLESGNGIVKDEIPDKKDLALEMVEGEIEQFVITTIRKLFLSIKHYQGKDVYTEKQQQKLPAKIFKREELESILKNLKALNINNPLLKSYLVQSASSLERELAE